MSITTNFDKYLNVVDQKLYANSEIEEWLIKCIYFERVYISAQTYTVFVEENTTHHQVRLKLRKWRIDKTLENSSRLGIFHVDKIKISEYPIELAESEQDFFKNLQLENLAISDEKFLVLDGLDCRLHIPKLDKTLKWNIDESMNADLKSAVKIIRALVVEYFENTVGWK